MQFIHQFGCEKEEELPLNNSIPLLEEIREIGFDKVLDTNDEFSKLKLKLPGAEIATQTITVRILKNQVFEYSLDSFPDYPVTRFKDNKKGFLGRILKDATNEYRELKKISDEIFMKIDEEFPTLKPERNRQDILKRRMTLSCEEADISYDYKTKRVMINSTEYETNNKENIFTELGRMLHSMNMNEDQEKDCGICYSNYLDGQLAAFPCQFCGQIYHETCLREWYTSIPECRSVFDKIIGKCLFCDEVREMVRRCWLFIKMII